MMLPNRTISQMRHYVEGCYAVVVIMVLTQGPVLKIWRTAELYTPVPITPTHQMTYLLFQIPALLILANRVSLPQKLNRPTSVLSLFLFWLLLSTFWTHLSRYTVIDATTLAITAFVGVYFAKSFSNREMIFITCIAMHLCILISYLGIKRNWSESIDPNGNWMGMYFNRNSLAPVVMVGILTLVILAVEVVRSQSGSYRFASIALIVDLLILDSHIFIKTGSLTSLLAAVWFVAIWCIWTFVRNQKLQKRISSHNLQKFVYPIWLAASIFVCWIGFSFAQPMMKLFGKNDFFSGRGAIWHFNWTGFLERPLIGWGWMAAWSTPEFLKRDLWWTVTGAQWSHNGYLEILLGGGLVAGLLFALYIAWSGYEKLDQVCESNYGQWSYSMSAFVLVSATQESFFIGNHFLWALFIACLTKNSTGDEHHLQTSTQPRI